MQSASVSNLEIFRTWRSDDDLNLDWLIDRLTGGGETEAMRIGKAFHSALEAIGGGETASLFADDYRFDFSCAIELPKVACRELPVEAQYGDLLVRGRVDAIAGKTVTDYKTTQQFDADRLMTGYQWRYYLDMMECDSFIWKVFVLREFGGPGSYEVKDVHTLTQKRYPDMHADCVKLASDYARFVQTVPQLWRHRTPLLETA